MRAAAAPASSGRSSSRTPPPPSSMAESGGYFPGCRKDANCVCDMCLASIDAILDLRKKKKPSAAATESTLTQRLRRGREAESSAASAEPSTPPLMSTAKSRPIAKAAGPEEDRRKGRTRGFPGSKILVSLVGLLILVSVDLGAPAMVLKPKMTVDVLRRFLKEESSPLAGDSKGKLRFLVTKAENVLGERFSDDCSSPDSLWEFNQEGGQVLFHWKCVLYTSFSEELSVWGSPLASSGLLLTGFSRRSLTILSGRITEWSGGKPVPTSRTDNNGSSWTCEKWSRAAVRMEAGTWVLEYKRSPLLQGTGLLQLAWEVSMQRASSMLKLLRQQPWRLIGWDEAWPHHLGRRRLEITRPTPT